MGIHKGQKEAKVEGSPSKPGTDQLRMIRGETGEGRVYSPSRIQELLLSKGALCDHKRPFRGSMLPPATTPSHHSQCKRNIS